jgi:hypothetical protein
VEATLDLENESVGRHEAYTRRKTLCAKGESLQSLLNGLLPRGLDEMHPDPELC